LDSVITDVMGTSAREMLDALIAGVTDVETMAQMARTRMRPKIPELRLALEGRFDDHHRLMLRLHLRHIDDLSAMIVELDTTVDALMAPFDEAATRLLSIPGVGKRTAETIVAEIGVDMTRFPSPLPTSRRGSGYVQGTTNRPVNTDRGKPAKATRRSAPRCAKRRGRRRIPETPTWRRSIGGSNDGWAPKVKAKPSSRSHTP
jgi:transposase